MREPFEAARGRRPRREDIQAGLAALQQGDAETARGAFLAILDTEPGVAPAHLGLGRVFAAEGDHRKALEHFQEALAIQPDLAPARLFSAESLEQLGEVESAFESYDAALAVDPSMSMAYIRKARLLERQNREEEGREVLAAAVRRLPQDGGLRIALANAMARGGVEQGEAEFRRAIELQPEMWYGHFGLGTALLRGKQYAAARDALQRAAQLAPDKPSVQAALGAAYTGVGDHVRAAAAFDEAVRLEPTNMRAAIGAAMARSAAGRHREALDLLRRFGRMGTRIPPYQRALGDVYFAMGRAAEAVEAYRAMILNMEGRGATEPDLARLAQPMPGEDAAEVARELRTALDAQRSGRAEQMRADPRSFRERLMSRRRGAAGGN